MLQEPSSDGVASLVIRDCPLLFSAHQRVLLLQATNDTVNRLVETGHVDLSTQVREERSAQRNIFIENEGSPQTSSPSQPRWQPHCTRLQSRHRQNLKAMSERVNTTATHSHIQIHTDIDGRPHTSTHQA